MLNKVLAVVIVLAVVAIAYFVSLPEPGSKVDEFNGVAIYYNGHVDNDFGRNVAPDGYNIGKKYQCVEFIKRYYYEYYNHKMPESYGHAKDYFNMRLRDGEFNAERGLVQYTNPSKSRPMVGDIIVMKGKYGHVGIVSFVANNAIEMAQQNTRTSRRQMHLTYHAGDGTWEINNSRVFGWLRLENNRQ